MGTVTIISSVLCDEVRRESSGQAILIGASPTGPAITKSDDDGKIARLAFYIEATVVNTKKISLRLYDDESENTIIESNLDISPDFNLDDEETDISEVEIGMVIVTNFEGVKISKPGQYSLQYKSDDDDWNLIRNYLFPELREEE